MQRHWAQALVFALSSKNLAKGVHRDEGSLEQLRGIQCYDLTKASDAVGVTRSNVPLEDFSGTIRATAFECATVSVPVQDPSLLRGEKPDEFSELTRCPNYRVVVCATMCYMERSLHVRLPEVLAAKLDRFAEAEGMTQSELVRQALRFYFANTVKAATETVSREIQPKLPTDGIDEDKAGDWYKLERGKRKGPKSSNRVLIARSL
jgi:hypothetical protein